MKKILCMLLSMSIFLTCGIVKIHADQKVFVSDYFELEDLLNGESIVINDNDERTFVIKVDNEKYNKMRKVTTNWSNGTIPFQVVTMYPHADYDKLGAYYTGVGFYMTYDGDNQKIIEVYSPRVSAENCVISGLDLSIITSKPTTTVSAKAEMTWIKKTESLTGMIASSSHYFRVEINKNNQYRLVWSI